MHRGDPEEPAVFEGTGVSLSSGQVFWVLALGMGFSAVGAVPGFAATSPGAIPGFPARPTRIGTFACTGLITFFARRYFATTSHTGSPDAPSATGAQLATLYFFAGVERLPVQREVADAPSRGLGRFARILEATDAHHVAALLVIRDRG